MIASLGMYDSGPARAANDRLWALARQELAHRGIEAPQGLTRGEGAYWPAWTAEDLVLSQTCGFPYRARLHGQVTLIGAPDHGLRDCPRGQYRSVLVARKDDPRADFADFATAPFAFNDDLSQSGWAAPANWAAEQGFALTPRLRTGGHRASAAAVAEGRADLAALDAVTWAMMQEDGDPAVPGLKIVALTPPTPALPYIAGPGADGPAIFAALDAAIAALSDEDRDTLHLRGLVALPAEAWLAVPIPAAPADLGAAS
ncbi:phosphate/phosphite/phosphonate ABC transporter substrate-binding protein [Xinfangfangia pollutisoli]|uniref:phosphate/phosphite/phosphonate ABC transporter substrate-binding protein n=1 Tax=Xinfangfangia pollutisoli TaxID=2865960 RepID=UPI001CD4F7D1|nr:PhnD/SsuA/transferrin family substrate-binding protein [Xinfangfangia pollutisoli]